MTTSPILIVEDNRDNQQLATWILEDAGYTVECANNAEDGIALLEQKPYSLVLMDISLPGMNGKEATQYIRQQNAISSTPIIALTAHAVLDERESILQSGVDELLTKPVDEEEMLKTVAEVLNTRH